MKHYSHRDDIFGQNWFSYPKLYEQMVNQFPSGSKFVEVGSWKGRSSSHMAVEIANSDQDISFYCVDTWSGSEEHYDASGSAYEPNIDRLYDIFTENMKPVSDYYIPLRMKSIEASFKFENVSLDFVFIDASHEYQDVLDDIKHWLPKVKPGGVLAGHDYYVQPHNHTFAPGVKQAVNESFNLYDLNTNEDCWIYKVPSPSELTK